MANGEPKQVIVIRNDLNMRRGKQIAQGAHASLKAILNLGQMFRDYSDINGNLIDIHYNITLFKERKQWSGEPDINHQAVIEWLEGRFTKICVQVSSEDELLNIYNNAVDAGIKCRALIEDAGLTEFGGVKTLTCCAIGPAYPEDVDKITSHLKLL
jgi:PTH2 family peptidyl-tRNA hydrolase